MQLLNSICVPILTYALEACSLTLSNAAMLNGCTDNAVHKIFHICAADNVLYIRNIFKVTGVSERCNLAKCKFAYSLYLKNGPVFARLRNLWYNEFALPLVDHDICLSRPKAEQIRLLAKSLFEDYTLLGNTIID